MIDVLTGKQRKTFSLVKRNRSKKGSKEVTHENLHLVKKALVYERV